MSQGDEKILRIRNLNEARYSMISRRYRDRATRQWLIDEFPAVKNSRDTDDKMYKLVRSLSVAN